MFDFQVVEGKLRHWWLKDRMFDFRVVKGKLQNVLGRMKAGLILCGRRHRQVVGDKRDIHLFSNSSTR